MKKKHSLKWALIGAALALLFMYGLDMASSGIERVYGPVQSSPGTAAGDLAVSTSAQPGSLHPADSNAPGFSEQAGQPRQTDQSAQAGQPSAAALYGPHLQDSAAAAYQPIEPRLPGAYGEYREPAVNRVADQTAGMLQSLSSSGIRLVVSLFDSFTN